jgi:hypothetical protein
VPGRPEGFYKALDEVFGALGGEHVEALGNEERLDLYVLLVHGVAGYLVEDGTVATYEEALELITFRLKLRDLPDAPTQE